MAPKRSRKVKGLLNSVENVYEAEYIVAQRQCQDTGEIEYCVKWNGYPHYHNTWEPATNLIDLRLLAEFLSGSRLTEGPIADLDISSTEVNRATNDNNNDTSGQQDSTRQQQVPKPLKGILKKKLATGSSGSSGGGGRKRKADGRKDEGQGGGKEKKKVKCDAAQPKKDEVAKTSKAKFFPTLLRK